MSCCRSVEQFWGDYAEPYFPSSMKHSPLFKVRIRVMQTRLSVPELWGSPPSSLPVLFDTWHSASSKDLVSSSDLKHNHFLASVSLMPWYRWFISLMRIHWSDSFVPCFNSALFEGQSPINSVSAQSSLWYMCSKSTAKLPFMCMWSTTV